MFEPIILTIGGLFAITLLIAALCSFDDPDIERRRRINAERDKDRARARRDGERRKWGKP